MAENKSAPTPEELVRELSSFPLLGAMFGRRARRFGLGMKIPDGPLAYESQHEPVALSETERMLLVMCGAGINGWNTGMEHTSAGEPDTGCNYPVRLLGRTYPSGAAIYASELIFTDDDGTYLTQLRDLDPQDILGGNRPADLAALFDRVKQHCVKLTPGRAVARLDRERVEIANFSLRRPNRLLVFGLLDLFTQCAKFLAQGL